MTEGRLLWLGAMRLQKQEGMVMDGDKVGLPRCKI